MEQKTIKSEIFDWLAAGQPYEEGVQIYAKYGNNSTVLKNFTRKETKTRKDKLAYKLVTIAGLPEKYITMDPGQLPVDITNSKPRSQTPDLSRKTIVDIHIDGRQKSEASKGEASKQWKGKIPFKDLPEDVQLLIVQRGSYVKQRRAKHLEFNDIPKTNDSETVEKRKAIIEEMDAIQDNINITHNKITYYEKHLKLPEKKKEGIVEQGLLKLKQTLMNLKSQRSKAKAKVYGTDKKEALAEGPRKEAAKKKLNELEPKINKLEKQLNK